MVCDDPQLAIFPFGLMNREKLGCHKMYLSSLTRVLSSNKKKTEGLIYLFLYKQGLRVISFKNKESLLLAPF